MISGGMRTIVQMVYLLRKEKSDNRKVIEYFLLFQLPPVISALERMNQSSRQEQDVPNRKRVRRLFAERYTQVPSALSTSQTHTTRLFLHFILTWKHDTLMKTIQGFVLASAAHILKKPKTLICILRQGFISNLQP